MKLLVVFLFFTLLCSANTLEHDVETFESIATAILEQEEATIYPAGDRIREIIKRSKKLHYKRDCNKAELIIAENDAVLPGECNHMYNRIFYNSYKSLKNSSHAIGAYYKHKGRNNLIFIEENLERLDITLPKQFDKYIESRR